MLYLQFLEFIENGSQFLGSIITTNRKSFLCMSTDSDGGISNSLVSSFPNQMVVPYIT